jgi:hypothetical protein
MSMRGWSRRGRPATPRVLASRSPNFVLKRPPISEGEEAVPVMAEGGPLVEPPEGPAEGRCVRVLRSR